jgi:hypothetical protein
MDFEEMKVLWDSQHEEPLYAVNQAGLRAMLLRNSSDFRRAVFWRDLREITIGTVASAGFLLFGGLLAAGQPERLASWFNVKTAPTAADMVAMIIAAGLWLHYAVWQYAGRKRQERRERHFDASVLGDLDREIARTEYQIRLARSVLWWGVLPVWTATFLFLFVASRLLEVSGPRRRSPRPAVEATADPARAVAAATRIGGTPGETEGGRTLDRVRGSVLDIHSTAMYRAVMLLRFRVC